MHGMCVEFYFRLAGQWFPYPDPTVQFALLADISEHCWPVSRRAQQFYRIAE